MLHSKKYINYSPLSNFRGFHLSNFNFFLKLQIINTPTPQYVTTLKKSYFPWLLDNQDIFYKYPPTSIYYHCPLQKYCRFQVTSHPPFVLEPSTIREGRVPKIPDVYNFGQCHVFRNLKRLRFIWTLLSHYTELIFSNFTRNDVRH